MKILLINPGVQTRRKLAGSFAPYLVPILPQGLAYVAASLGRAGHEVRVEDQFATGTTGEEIARRVAREGFELVGISTLTALQHETGILCRIIKNRSPSVRIVLGNIHASALPERSLEETRADVVVVGEGEATMVALVESLEKGRDLEDVKSIVFRRGEKFIATLPREPIRDLDSVPRPAWDLFDLSNYQRNPPFFNRPGPIVPLLINRGCPYQCVFCSQNRIYGRRERTRSIPAVVDEIEWVTETFGAAHFGLNDAIFPIDPEQAFSFGEEIRRRGLSRKINWFTELRVDLIDPPMLRTLKNAGLYLIILGIESCDDGVLARSKKGQTFSDIERAAKTIREAGIQTAGFFVLGLPGDTGETIQKTIEQARDLPLTFAKFNRATPYPGTELYDIWVSGDERRRETSWEKFSAWAPAEKARDVLFAPEGLTLSELRNLQNRAVRRFYTKPSRTAFLLSRRLIGLENLAGGARTLAEGVLESWLAK